MKYDIITFHKGNCGHDESIVETLYKNGDDYYIHGYGGLKTCYARHAYDVKVSAEDALEWIHNAAMGNWYEVDGIGIIGGAFVASRKEV